MDLDCRFIRSGGMSGTLSDVVEERVDVALGGIAVTGERERRIDFTHTYFHTGLGILVPEKRGLALRPPRRSFFTENKMLIFSFFTNLHGRLRARHLAGGADPRRGSAFLFPQIFSRRDRRRLRGDCDGQHRGVGRPGRAQLDREARVRSAHRCRPAGLCLFRRHPFVQYHHPDPEDHHRWPAGYGGKTRGCTARKHQREIHARRESRWHSRSNASRTPANGWP